MDKISTHTSMNTTTVTLVTVNQKNLFIPGFLFIVKEEESFRKMRQVGRGGASAVFLADPLDREMKRRLDRIQMPYAIVVKEIVNMTMSD
jgi:hypothetical protein